MISPREAGYRMPAEWEPHEATWVAWPSHDSLWAENIDSARKAVASLVAALVEGETAQVLVPDDANERLARASLPSSRVRIHREPFGDIWLRDTAPLFLCGDAGARATVGFAFNGWGGKYVLDGDNTVSERIASLVGLRAFSMPFVLEGGAVELDGEGTVLTTRQCLLNPNRNPRLTSFAIEGGVLESLGCTKMLWLDEGLENDHTDGHIDTLARFVRPGLVVAMEPRTADDPNREVLHSILRAISTFQDAKGRRLEVTRVPSPGRVCGDDGRVLPASYVNFYIANACVVVPTYGSPYDDEAVDRIGALFPGRRTLGVEARGLLTGGGAFHCITQQEPRRETP